ncbi:hypothetical protein IW139_001553, partial [Coemansia sp. RSA 353]
MQRVVRSTCRGWATCQSVRAVHTSTVVQGKRLSNRKAELAAQRAAEAEAVLQAKERLRKLKDTGFLNSLAHPERLFETTQITEEDRAISLSSDSIDESGGDTVRRNADSGQYSCH